MEHRIDPWLMLAVVGILGASLMTLHGSSRVVGLNLLLRQLLWLMSLVRLDIYERLAPLFYGFGIVALVVVLFVGEARGGNKAWIAIGPVTIQPSEFARLATILLAAAWLAHRGGRNLRVGDVVIAVAIVAVPVFLVVLEPDLGVGLTYLPVLAGVLVLGGLPRWVWIMLILLAVLGLHATWQYVLKPYQKDRVLTVFEPERDPFGAGYQVRQSKIAVGSGGTGGQGLGRHRQSSWFDSGSVDRSVVGVPGCRQPRHGARVAANHRGNAAALFLRWVVSHFDMRRPRCRSIGMAPSVGEPMRDA